MALCRHADVLDADLPAVTPHKGADHQPADRRHRKKGQPQRDQLDAIGMCKCRSNHAALYNSWNQLRDAVRGSVFVYFADDTRAKQAAKVTPVFACVKLVEIMVARILNLSKGG